MNLNVNGFCLPVLRLIHDYLPHKKHRARVNDSYSEWLVVMFGLPQGSTFSFFFIHKDIDIANFEEDNKPYLLAKSLEDFPESLD